MGHLKMRVIACVLALACTAGMMQPIPSRQEYAADTTIAELEAKRAENDKLIAQYESDLATYQANQKKEKAYQEALQLKIDTIQDNLAILDQQLEAIKEDIFNLDIDIQNLEKTIAQQEVDIAEGLEQFKLRLRAMYVNGNDSLASALVGATDFYDLLSKYELISCVARHDDELVNGLKEQLESYNQNLITLNNQMTQLEEQKVKEEEKRTEMQSSMEELNAAYDESVAEQQRQAAAEANRKQQIADLEATNAVYEKREQEIRDAIKRAEEEAARKKAAEEAKKKAEEEAKKKAEEEAAKNNQNSSDSSSSSGSSDSSSSSTNDTPSYSSASFGWPCPGHYYISSYYGYRWGKLHAGYDIAQNQGASVVASRSGTVIAVSNSCSHNYGKGGNCCGNGYGNYVLVSHGDGFTTMYAHLASVSVSVGQSVSKGAKLGTVGSTGFSTGFHLHFEIRKNGSAVNPSNYLNY